MKVERRVKKNLHIILMKETCSSVVSLVKYRIQKRAGVLMGKRRENVKEKRVKTNKTFRRIHSQSC